MCANRAGGMRGMAKKPHPGDRVRVTTWTGMPDYFRGDRGTVLSGPEPAESDEPAYLVAMDQDAGKGIAHFTVDEIEVDE
jgi:hypothetical protein